MTYKFDPVRRAYWDDVTRRFIPNSRMIEMRESIVAAFSENAATWTDRFTSGELTINEWREGFRSLVRNATEAQFVLARGGEAQMTPDDWEIVDTRVAAQDQYIVRLGEDIESGAISAQMASYRSTLYASSTRSAFEQGRSRSWTDSRMPAYPGDGNTECMGSCQCRWDYRMVDGQVHATWKMNASAESCGGCSANAMLYNPYIVSQN